MIGWLHVTLIAFAALIFAILLLLIIQRCFLHKPGNHFITSDAETGHNNPYQNGITRLHQVSPHHHGNNNLDKEAASANNNNKNYALFQKVVWKKPVFSWADHPSLVTEAVENGWPRFAFTTFITSPSVNNKSRVLLSSPCVISTGDNHDQSSDLEITWEVCEESSDYMQKVRFLNPSISKKKSNGLSVIRTGLPLPGPHLENNSFPQEAYFEITILSVNRYYADRLDEKDQMKGKINEGDDKVKLIEEDFNKKNSPDDSFMVTSTTTNHSQRKIKMDELIRQGKLLQEQEGVLVSVGLVTGGINSLPLKIPGSYIGSVGFSSTGSVYLDGTKLVSESPKNEWSAPDKVIGCGYNPSQKKVFFTVESQLVHEIHCNTEDFSSPLYPILASNTDTVVLVNLGQRPFKYLPANSQRTPNPCFVRASSNNSPALGFEDSKELFSMERIDLQWMQRSGLARSNNNTVNSVRSLEYDVESEGDLFEIVLDHIHSTGRSPYTHTTYNNP